MALPGVPFAADTRTIANSNGQVLQENGARSDREYVTGWSRRGPSGVLGTNKSDATEAVKTLLTRAPTPRSPTTDLRDLLMARNVEFVDLSGWARIKAAERALGSSVAALPAN